MTDPILFLDLKAPYLELKEQLDAAYRRVMDSGWYILGEEVEQFEAEFADFCGARHCIGVGNGLEALQLALMAAGIGESDEVIVPSNTYIASWLAVTHVGARVVPVEPRVVTYNINPDLIEQAITTKTKAIMPVHLYGERCEMEQIATIARRHNLLILEDSAQMHLRGQAPFRADGVRSVAAYSFYPGKNLGALGDAGAIVTNDDKLSDQFSVLRNYGCRQKYQNEVRGHNSRLDPLQAAFLRVKLGVLEAWNARRGEIADFYLQELGGLDGLTLPAVASGCVHGWHQFAVRHSHRDALQAWLQEQQIGTLIHYPIPPHLSQAYADHHFTPGQFPIAEEIANTELSLPIGPHLSHQQAERVAEAVRTFCSQD
ncbi:MAG: DegT/DnrJ/EryC1/StrS family aminotransferase [Anaerolineaceae bacterium]